MSRYSGAPSPVLVVCQEDEGRAPVILTAIGARKLTDEIRHHLGSALVKLRQAREGEAHIVLGYPDWHTYCEREFGDLSELALPVVERRALVESMRTVRPPLSHEEIGKRLGVSVGTVYKDRRAIGAADDLPKPRQLAPVPDVGPDYSRLGTKQEALLRVRDQGDRGLTSIELQHETGWKMGTAPGALSKLAHPSRGLIEQVELVRLNRRAYVLTAKGRSVAAQLDEQLAAMEDEEG